MATHDDTPIPPKVPSDARAARVEAPRATTAGAPASGDRSLGELFSELSQGVSTLLSQEIALVKVEMSQKISRAAKDATMLIIGGVLAFGGYIALIATLVLILASLGLHLWLSALIVTVLLLAVGGLLVQRGLADLKKVNPLPEKTIESLQEDKEWAKEQLK